MNTTDKPKCTAADGKTEVYNLPGVGLVVSAAAFNALVRERDEADRRAGAAERHTSKLADDLRRIDRVHDQMKDQWGVSRNVSFDVVWAEALALKAAMQEKQS